MAWNAQLTRMALAGALALGGVVAAYFALSPLLSSGPNAAPAPSQPQPPREQGPIPASFDVQVTPENAQEVVEEIARTFRAGLEEVMIQPMEADAAAAAVREELEIYLTGDFEQFLQLVQSRGANMPALRDPDDEEALENYRHIWSSSASTVAFRPIAMEQVEVRPRILNGEVVEQPDLGSPATTTAPTRYGMPEDPVQARMTVIEFVVPVMHIWEGEETPMWWGVWMAKHPETGEWLPWRFTQYDPTSSGNATFGPVF